MSKAFPRKKRKLLVQFVDASGESQTGYTRDVSLSGFFVIAPTLPRVGPLTVTLHLPNGKTLPVYGRVVRQAEPPETALVRSANAGFGFGLNAYSEEYTRFIETLQ
jgi:hypothetical protein